METEVWRVFWKECAGYCLCGKKYPIRVVNISVGAKPNLEQRQKKRLILGAESLWDAGIAVVASAGNDGPERGSIASPGDSRKIITVGAYEEIRRGRTRMGQRWKYSGRGPSDTCIVKPDLVAPGTWDHKLWQN